MKPPPRSVALRAGAVFFVAFAAAAAFGHARYREERGAFFRDAEALSEAERKGLESAPIAAVSNAAWAFGNLRAVKAVVSSAFNRLPEADTPNRVRAALRLAIVETNPDGQAALFNGACSLDAKVCDQLKEAAEREVRARVVPPGNRLPLYLLGGHPPIPGHERRP